MKQGYEAKKTKIKKVRKDKKRKRHLGQQDRQGQPKDGIVTIIGANAMSATTTGGGGQKKKKFQDVSEITYHSCNKKGHYISDCTESKN